MYSADLRKHYDLADPSWKYDIMPEIADGHNVLDFVDPDIDAKLAELEREEAELEVRRVGGWGGAAVTRDWTGSVVVPQWLSYHEIQVAPSRAQARAAALSQPLAIRYRTCTTPCQRDCRCGRRHFHHVTASLPCSHIAGPVGCGARRHVGRGRRSDGGPAGGPRRHPGAQAGGWLALGAMLAG